MFFLSLYNFYIESRSCFFLQLDLESGMELIFMIGTNFLFLVFSFVLDTVLIRFSSENQCWWIFNDWLDLKSGMELIFMNRTDFLFLVFLFILDAVLIRIWTENQCWWDFQQLDLKSGKGVIFMNEWINGTDFLFISPVPIEFSTLGSQIRYGSVFL